MSDAAEVMPPSSAASGSAGYGVADTSDNALGDGRSEVADDDRSPESANLTHETPRVMWVDRHEPLRSPREFGPMSQDEIHR